MNNELAKGYEGARLAADHADREYEDWSCKALAYFFLFANRGEPFQTDDVRAFAEADGLAPPPDKRAWGAIAKRAKAAKVVVHMGTRNQKARGCHGSPKAVWQKRTS